MGYNYFIRGILIGYVWETLAIRPHRIVRSDMSSWHCTPGAHDRTAASTLHNNNKNNNNDNDKKKYMRAWYGGGDDCTRT